jgi:hypothetical protein
MHHCNLQTISDFILDGGCPPNSSNIAQGDSELNGKTSEMDRNGFCLVCFVEHIGFHVFTDLIL